MIKDYFLLAGKNLKHRGIRSWLTLLGIFIGVVAVVSLMGLGDGLKAAVSAQFGISNTEVITVQAGGMQYGPPGSGVTIPLNDKDLEEIRKLNHVEIAIKRSIETLKLEFNNKITLQAATNIPQDEKERKFVYSQIELKAKYGRLLKASDDKKVVLGINFNLDQNGLGKPIKIGNSVLINGEKFEVVGILEKKGSFIFDNIILLNADALNKLMGNETTIDVIAVKVDSQKNMDLVKNEIEKTLRRTRNVKVGQENFDVSTPQAIMATIGGVIMGVQIFIVIIAMISVFVGAVGIINTMTTSVMERKKEIGIMKAIGAQNYQIFLQFFVEAGMLGLVGGIIGVLIGTLATWIGIIGINNFIGSELKIQLNLALIFAVLTGSFLIGATAGIVPALKAAHQNPVDALKG